MPEDNCIKQNRIGRFKISRNLLETATDDQLKVLFQDFVVVRCEAIYHSNVLEYTAYSPLFEPVESGCEVPLYVPLFSTERVTVTTLEIELAR